MIHDEWIVSFAVVLVDKETQVALSFMCLLRII